MNITRRRIMQAPAAVAAAALLPAAAQAAPRAIEALSGQLALRIPPETQNGRAFRLRGKGLARPGGGRGDLLARVNVVLPTGLTERERELFTQLWNLRERQAAYAGA